MKFEYDPPSGPSKMISHDEQDLKHKFRLASNNLVEGEPEENLLDGEFYWKNDDPESGQRTLYAKRADGLVKIVTLDTDNTPIFPGLNEVDLGTKEVIGFLPLSKLSKGVESSIDNITNLVVITKSGDIKVFSKDTFTDKIIEDVDASINKNYFNKTKDVASITMGGTGRKDGLARGIKDGVLRTQNTWQTDNTRGFDVFYWQDANYAKLGLPTTAGAMISNIFTDDLKGFLALNLSRTEPELRIKSYNSDWKMLAFDDDVVNKMPKVSKTSGVGYLQEVIGQGVPVTYRLPSDGTYFYFLTCTNDYNNYNNYNASNNKAGIAEGGTEIISASMNKKTFGGFIWRIQ